MLNHIQHVITTDTTKLIPISVYAVLTVCKPSAKVSIFEPSYHAHSLDWYSTLPARLPVLARGAFPVKPGTWLQTRSDDVSSLHRGHKLNYSQACLILDQYIDCCLEYILVHRLKQFAVLVWTLLMWFPGVSWDVNIHTYLIPCMVTCENHKVLIEGKTLMFPHWKTKMMWS